jgi:hypothetical protein
MTEAHWLEATDAVEMLKALAGKVTDRKLRLFGCACCRPVWDLLVEECFTNAVGVAERFADGLADKTDLATARRISGAALERSGLAGINGPAYCALGSAWSSTRMPAWTAAIYPLWVFTRDTERATQVALLREVFGNPFRPIAIETEWLTPDVVSRAEAIYAGRAFERMPTLGDALEEVGCKEINLLSHCRDPLEHVRGCWVLDALLGRS